MDRLGSFKGIENPRVLGSIPSPGHHYLKNPAYGWVFAFLYPLRIEFSLLSGNSDFFP